ncbi:hypothetical protein J1605_012700 [Eschrichtius robustus]|uniref:Uncharacterized protein n=1 Tax=Eschrichtius robustus TaxID=9764 RepID=A0AB34GGZ1_ESCRO|nr:hypothetical protein J1605_012700 [Eschrichtius robustus]
MTAMNLNQMMQSRAWPGEEDGDGTTSLTTPKGPSAPALPADALPITLIQVSGLCRILGGCSCQGDAVGEGAGPRQPAQAPSPRPPGQCGGEFVRLAKRLGGDPALEKQIVANGREYVRMYHSWQVERNTYGHLVRMLEGSSED